MPESVHPMYGSFQKSPEGNPLLLVTQKNYPLDLHNTRRYFPLYRHDEMPHFSVLSSRSAFSCQYL